MSTMLRMHDSNKKSYIRDGILYVHVLQSSTHFYSVEYLSVIIDVTFSRPRRYYHILILIYWSCIQNWVCVWIMVYGALDILWCKNMQMSHINDNETRIACQSPEKKTMFHSTWKIKILRVGSTKRKCQMCQKVPQKNKY